MARTPAFSYWEKQQYFDSIDVLIVGAGLVGLQTALELKARMPLLKITVIDRHFLPLGASTRNAGFACFGSPTELLFDLQTRSEEEVFTLFSNRYKGVQKLRHRVRHADVEWIPNGGYELIHPAYSDIRPDESHIDYLNTQIENYTGLKDYFVPIKTQQWNGPMPDCSHIFFNKEEACLHPVKLWEVLHRLAKAQGINVLFSLDVSEWKEDAGGVFVKLASGITVFARKMLICVNAFAKQLVPGLDIWPARNQVFVLKPMREFLHDACFHVNCGFIYFRGVHGKLLIGGGRHIATDEEYGTDWTINEKIKQFLLEFAKSNILKDNPFVIESHWVGILGLGPAKKPIIEMVSQSVGVAVRMGGMGVALSSLAAEGAAEMLYQNL